MIPKFRAWDKAGKEMLIVHGIDYDDEGVCTKEVFDDEGVGYFIHFSNIELMQSTGLKDKNGVEIFKGDILKVNEMIGLVKFGRYTDDEYIIYGLDGWLFSEIYHNRYIDTPLTEYVLNSDYSVEIIGNIYEHPRLLEED